MASRLGRIILLVLSLVIAGQPILLSASTSITVVGGERFADGTWDYGRVGLRINGHLEMVAYGQFSTPEAIASALAVKFTKYCGCQGGNVCARATGSTIMLQEKSGAAIDSVSGFSISDAGFASGSFGINSWSGPGGLAPKITLLSPSSGKVGAQITINGQGFGAAIEGLNYVAFNGVMAVASSWSDTNIVVTVPANASTGGVVVTADNTNSNGWPFTIIPDTLPSPVLSGTLYQYKATSFESNGNITGIEDSVNGVWGYGYDNLNRLTSGTPSSGPFQTQPMTWSYDPFGNRTTEGKSGTPSYTANFNSNNQVIGYGYDASGDVSDDGAFQYLYDAEGRLCALRNKLTGFNTRYIYDAEGNRVAKGSNGVFTCDDSAAQGFTPTERYIVGLSGENLSKVDGQGKWIQSDVYAGGQLLATYDSSGMHFNLTDPLGTRRFYVQADLSSYQQCTSLPFGNNSNCVNPKFTGKDRDPESGKDYFLARYYNSTTGRFLSPDWSVKQEPVPYANLDDPQSLNLYSYVKNNPLSRVDKDGHCLEDACVMEVTGAIFVTGMAMHAVTTWIHSSAGQSAITNLGNAISGIFHSSDARQTPTQPYDTGTANDLKGNSQVGDGLDIHHVPQSQPASQTVEGYDKGSAPAIALPKGEHKAIPTEKGEATRTPRDQLAKDVRDLRNHTNAPNSQIQKVVEQNKQQYPQMSKPKQP